MDEKIKIRSTKLSAIAIEDLFNLLSRHIQQFEYEQAIKVSDQILKVESGDEDAIRCEVMALVKSNFIEEALVAIKDYSKKDSIEDVFGQRR